MSAGKALVGAMAIYGVGEALTRLLNFALLPLYTSYLTPRDYGVIAVLGVLALLVRPLFSLGIETAMGLCYFESVDSAHRGSVVWTAFGLLLVSGVVMVGLGAATGDSASRIAFGAAGYRPLILLALVSSAASILAQPLMQAVQFERMAKTYVGLSAIAALATIGASILLVVVLRRGARGWIEAEAAGRVATLLIFLVPVAVRWTARLNGAIARRLLQFGMPLIPGFAFVFALQQGNKYILQWLNGLDTLGLYNIGFNLGVAAIGLPVAAFQRAWTPHFMAYADRPDEARRHFGAITTYYAFGFGVLSLLAFAVARPLVLVMTTDAFNGAYLAVGLSGAAQVLYGAFSLLLPGPYFARNVRVVTVVQGLAAAFSILANIVFISWLGLVGAGLGLAAGAAVQVLLLDVLNRRSGYLRPDWDRRRVLRFGALYVFVAGLLLWDRQFTLAAEIAVAAGASLVATVGAALLLGPDDRRRAVGAMRRLVGGMASASGR